MTSACQIQVKDDFNLRVNDRNLASPNDIWYFSPIWDVDYTGLLEKDLTAKACVTVPRRSECKRGGQILPKNNVSRMTYFLARWCFVCLTTQPSATLERSQSDLPRWNLAPSLPLWQPLPLCFFTSCPVSLQMIHFQSSNTFSARTRPFPITRLF